MNKEKIGQLSKQAIEQVNKEHTKLGPDFWIEIYNQKFAELIVRECLSMLDKHYDACVASNDIKEHFGVE